MRSLPALSESNPCGPDLEYDPAFMALEGLAKGKVEQQFGDTLVAAEPPNWKSVLDSCDSLLARTRDLRVAVYRARALISLNGVPGAAEGYALISHLVEHFWQDLNPKLDADDDHDPTMRVNALAALLGPTTGLRELRSAVWLRHRGAQCTVRQALACLTGADGGGEPAVSQAEMDAMIGSLAVQERVNWAKDAHDSIEVLHRVVNERVGSEAAPDFKALLGLLKPLANFFDRDSAVAADTASDSGADAMHDAPVRSTGSASADLRSREDVIRSLERACQYLERHEPSNPAPLLIRRAQRLLSMSFIDIMKDMAPDALATVESIAGTQTKTDSND